MKFKGFDNWVEIFEGGDQTDSKGVHHDGDTLINNAISSFDPSFHEPPVVAGHPVSNAPAYGWVSALKKVDNKLLAKFKDIVPEFGESVKKGQYKKRSASFYPDGRLKHVGFLGAAAPAIKGLKDLAFDDNDIAIVFDFSEANSWSWETVADVFRRLREYIIEKDSKETADTVISSWDIDLIHDEANRKVEEKEPMKFADFLEAFKFWKENEKDPNTQLPTTGIADVSNIAGTFSEADIEAAKVLGAIDERKKAEAEFAERELINKRSTSAKEFSDFCDLLIKDGRIPPAWVDAGIKEFANKLDNEAEIAFSEGDEKSSVQGWFKNFLEGFEKSTLFQELATKERAMGGPGFAEDKQAQEMGESIASKVN